MTLIRPVRGEDLAALYAVALGTGKDGADASALYRDGRLLGEIYVAPYAALEPGGVFVAEDGEGVAGYVVGVRDTRAFEARLEAEWWPPLRTRHHDPSATAPELWTPDEVRAFMIHHPRPAPEGVVSAFPAHLHLNLLPRLQGRGIGRALLDAFGAGPGRPAIPTHVGVSPANARGAAFWRRQGFAPLEGASTRPLWMGRPAA
jgi:GNAT superfamily N-acetyltransferase